MKLRNAIAVGTVALLIASAAGAANTYYVTPNGSAITGADGSQGNPFGTVSQALNSGRVYGGDTVLLMDGDHGPLALNGVNFSAPVTIMSENGRNGHVDSIALTGSTSNLTLADLTVWPADPYAVGWSLINSDYGTSNIVLDGLDVLNGADAGNYLNWSKTEWNNRKTDATDIRGRNSKVLNSTFTGFYHGIQMRGPDAVVAGNVVDGFGGDGMRGLGDRNRFTGNRVQNCFVIDGNHDDGFQAWPVSTHSGATLDDLVFENNVVLEWTHGTAHALRCSLQGVGMFNGGYVNTTIRNNVISVTAYHGISVYGSQGTSIVNNSVVHGDGNAVGWPWIGIFIASGHSNQNILVSNNIAMKYNASANTSQNIVIANNGMIRDPQADLADVDNYNFAPASFAFIDSANPNSAPAGDFFGTLRPWGAGPDLGAIEADGSNRTISTATTTSGGTSTGAGSGSSTGSGGTTGGTTGGTGTTTGGTGSTDTGSTDTGTTDTGSTDTGGTGSTDTGGTGSTDTGSTDTGSTGGTDTGSTDTGGTDTGATYDGTSDTGGNKTKKNVGKWLSAPGHNKNK